MNTRQRFDVVVVGAGPSGASAAYHLAVQGWRVALFEKRRMPREKACGDGLGMGSIAVLDAMGVLTRLSGCRAVGGVEIRLHGDRQETSAARFAGQAHGLVVPRTELDTLVMRRAQDVGAHLFEGCRVTGFGRAADRIDSVHYVADVAGAADEVLGVDTRYVVLADGGTDKLRLLAGFAPHAPETTGQALRGYYENVPALPDAFQLHLPLMDADGARTLPGYGWVFPLAGGRANIGVGYFPVQSADREINLRRLQAGFLERLARAEPRMAAIRQVGRLIGGPLHSGMDPQRCAAGNALVTGDAAGLVDPFTGEGIHTALASGRCAAQVLVRALCADDPALLAEYGRMLEARYGDRFQLGRRFVRSYAFMWRLLQTTTDQHSALADTMRHGLFSYGDPDAAPDAPARGPHAAYLAAVRGGMHTVAGRDFPLLTRIAFQFENHALGTLRQSLAYWSYRIGGREPDEQAVAVSACLELAALAHAMQDQAATGRVPGGRHGSTGRWATAFAVMCGNYLLTRAFRTMRVQGDDLLQYVVLAIAKLCDTRLGAAVRDQADERQLAAYSCGLACRVAARMAGCPDDVQAQLDRFGAAVGAAQADAGTGRATDPARLAEAMDALRTIPHSRARARLGRLAAAAC
ncbi:geranylgeranyl reductase family protein [Massilia sp. Root335]|uniref:geranylgeranyl reductase family protein n=1 Tax=Massilia sp. Root335 TaxID=1736517 RepID=UPI00138EFFD3|nr:geranylgeranyl reductase family protein [Massilia sp. Root335]